MAITFTQFIRPHGTPKHVEISRSKEVEEIAERIVERGYSFECEHLPTGEVSLTIVDRNEEVDVGIEIARNGPDVPAAVDRLIMNFSRQI